MEHRHVQVRRNHPGPWGRKSAIFNSYMLQCLSEGNGGFKQCLLISIHNAIRYHVPYRSPNSSNSMRTWTPFSDKPNSPRNGECVACQFRRCSHTLWPFLGRMGHPQHLKGNSTTDRIRWQVASNFYGKSQGFQPPRYCATVTMRNGIVVGHVNMWGRLIRRIK